jgi:hypothetical protein
MKLTFVALALAGASALVTGCTSDVDDGSSTGSTSSTTGGGQDPLDAAAFCDKSIERETSCGQDVQSDEKASCEANQACVVGLIRDGALGAFQQCLLARDCMTSDDACVTKIADEQADTPTSTSFGAACMKKLSDCEAAGTSIHDDVCYGYKLYSDAVLAGLEDCMAKSCGEVNGCVDAVVAAASPSCK